MKLLPAVFSREWAARRRLSTNKAQAEGDGQAACTHCALPIPAERRGSAYCCNGCEVVHGLLSEQGLLRFYDLGGRATGAVGAPPRSVVLDWYDDAVAAARTGGRLVSLTLDVQGIRCAACVWLLQELWRRRGGGPDLRIDPSLGRATFTCDPEQRGLRAYLETVARFGYPMAPASKEAPRDDGLLVRLGICVALAMNAMLLGVSLYFGLDEEGGELLDVFLWVGALLATASVVVGGPVFFRAALAGLRAGMVHMDLPISIGLLLAWGGSMWGLLTGGEVYFDTVAIFIAFMLGGRFLQQRTLRRNRDQVLRDDGAEHLRVRRRTAAGIEQAPVAKVRKDDELLLAPGDLVPVQCRLLAACASFSLDWINGESEPRAFAQGELVPAGAFQAGRSAVRAVATADYLQSGLAELLNRPPVDREDTRGRVTFWDRLARWYSTGVLAAAALGCIAWWFVDPSRSLPVAVSVLVITCPCAMGIATPLAFHLATAALRRGGVFVRSASLFDKVPLLRKVVFDKTGTVTFGGLRASTGDQVEGIERDVLATMAASSNHPASQAVLEALGPDARFLDDLVVQELPGKGLLALHEGIEYRFGSASHVATGGVVFTEAPAARAAHLAAGSRLVATFVLEEDFRSGAEAEVAALRRRGLDVHLLSGDRVDRVEAAALRMGIEPARAHGAMSPDQKAAYVRELDDGDVLMVGDGINDAPAFAEAFCAGTPALDRPVLPSRADFFFRGAQMGAVSSVFDVSLLLRRTIRTNLALALAYNLSTIVLCFAGAMTPVLCAILMPLSSLALVTTTGWRMRRAWRPVS